MTGPRQVLRFKLHLSWTLTGIAAQSDFADQCTVLERHDLGRKYHQKTALKSKYLIE